MRPPKIARTPSLNSAGKGLCNTWGSKGAFIMASFVWLQGHFMGNRLSQIATRTGDDGTTGLADGTRVSKDHLRVAAMGDVDELNSSIGVLLTAELADSI